MHLGGIDYFRLRMTWEYLRSWNFKFSTLKFILRAGTIIAIQQNDLPLSIPLPLHKPRNSSLYPLYKSLNQSDLFKMSDSVSRDLRALLNTQMKKPAPPASGITRKLHQNLTSQQYWQFKGKAGKTGMKQIKDNAKSILSAATYLSNPAAELLGLGPCRLQTTSLDTR